MRPYARQVRRRHGAGALLAAGLLAVLTACAPAGASPEGAHGDAAVHESTPSASAHGHQAEADVVPASAPLRSGERYLDLALPEPYAPSAQAPGTDDYRCFVLDPGLSADAFVTGVDVLPERAELVHHVILFRLPPEQVAAAERLDAAEDGQGWTCFGGPGLPLNGLDDAAWLGAWAPGGGEKVTAEGLGIPVAAGSRVVVQMHYSLLQVPRGEQAPTDRSAARLRVTDATADLTPLETVLLVAPVELACRPEHAGGELCDRETALDDVADRFGDESRVVANGLQLICGASANRGSPVQSCDREITEPTTLHAAAAHMHLLGETMRIEVNPGRPGARTVLDVQDWDFDNQGATSLPEPVALAAGDTLRVTCRHDQANRDLLPAFEGVPERYVLWGEGTTDEMCLGIVMVTRP